MSIRNIAKLWVVLLTLSACSEIDIDTPEVRETSGAATPSVETRPNFPDTLPDPVPVPQSVHVVPAGEILTLALIDSLNTAVDGPGTSFRARLVRPVVLDGREILPEGALGDGHVVDVDDGEGGANVREMSLTLTQLTFDDHVAEVTTGPFIVRRDIDSFLNSQQIDIIASRPSAVGSLIALGDATGAVAASDNADIQLPQDIRINFVLKEPVRIDSFPGLNRRSDRAEGEH